VDFRKDETNFFYMDYMPCIGRHKWQQKFLPLTSLSADQP